MRPFRFLFLLYAALLFTNAMAQELAPIPPLNARVMDAAGVLKPEQRAKLEKKLQAHEQKTGNQVAILTIPDHRPEAIEQYSMRVAESWKIGRKDIDDGVILIISKNARKMRLEVGYGAEGVIPDAYAKRIIDEVLAPYFRKGDFYGGLNEATTVIHKLLNEEPFPEPKRTKKSRTMPSNLFFFIVFFIVIILYSSIRHAIRRSTTVYGNIGGRHHHGYGGYYGGFGGGGGGFGGGGASGGW